MKLDASSRFHFRIYKRDYVCGVVLLHIRVFLKRVYFKKNMLQSFLLDKALFRRVGKTKWTVVSSESIV